MKMALIRQVVAAKHVNSDLAMVSEITLLGGASQEYR